MAKMAEVNGKTAEIEDKMEVDGCAIEPTSDIKIIPQEKPARTWNYYQIVMHPKLTTRVVVLCAIKFYLYMTFFGCLIALSSLGGSLFVNSIIACVAEGVGYILACKKSICITILKFPIVKAHLFSTNKLLKASLQIVIASGVSFIALPSISCDSFFLCQSTVLQGMFAFVRHNLN